ncbi:MAG: hypothetical protein Q7S88_01585, partial [Candidatus Daviesbacteria bacterium]|nr:hypothetical protein [Candidatus Daviesbacteria bacterium]
MFKKRGNSLFSKFLSSLLISLIVLFQGMVYLLLPTEVFAIVSGTFTAAQTVANVSAVNNQTAVTATTVANVAAGTDNQTAVTATTVANVAEVKASRTLTVGALPAATESIVIGTCTVTFIDTGDDVDDVDCTGGATVSRFT